MDIEVKNIIKTKSVQMSRKKMIEESIAECDSISDYTIQMLNKLIDKKTMNGEYFIKDKDELISLVNYVENFFEKDD